MKISLNLIGTGLGQNGGSATLIKSANTLQKLGHDVTIVDGGKNQNTWNPIECNHIVIKELKDFPVADVVIATGINTLENTNKLPTRCGKKYHYIRGWETWKDSEDKLIKILKESKTKKIVNSIGLKNKLKEYDMDSVIIRPGYDFDEIYPLDVIKNKEDIIIGGLFNSGAKRSTKRTEWISEVYEYLKSRSYDIKLFMFGSDGTPKFDLDFFIKNPTIKEKNELYNKIDVWLSPSCLEGLHIAPAEAMLTKCAVVGNNSPLSGTEDYLIDQVTGLVSQNNFDSFLSNVEILVKHKMMRIEFGRLGREKILSLGSREDNMKKMVEVLSE